MLNRSGGIRTNRQTSSAATGHRGGVGVEVGREFNLKELVQRNKHRVRVETVVTSNQHAARKALHDWLSLKMEVAQHGVALPPADKLNGVLVHIGIEKGHGATGTEGTSTDVIGRISICCPLGCGSVLQEFGDVRRLNLLGSCSNVGC